MTDSAQKNRVIFLDILRAFAVFMMVQGHTVDSTLGEDFRTSGSVFHTIWFYMRGLTAPIFLFTSGTVFMYLLKRSNKPFMDNKRVIKGIRRAGLLFLIGYLLRFPNYNIFHLQYATDAQWDIFFASDVLHLIAFGLLFTILFAYISYKFKFNDYYIFALGTLAFILLNIPFSNIDWNSFLPKIIGNYFYIGGGSQFPLFPWLAYFFMGAILGSYMAKNPKSFSDKSFGIKLAIFGGILFFAAYGVEFIENALKFQLAYQKPSIVFHRIAVVLLFNAVFIHISLYIKSIPSLIILLGRNTLLIYAVHVFLIYNGPIRGYFNRTYTLDETLIMAAGMLSLMILLVKVVALLNVRNKTMVAN